MNYQQNPQGGKNLGPYEMALDEAHRLLKSGEMTKEAWERWLADKPTAFRAPLRAVIAKAQITASTPKMPIGLKDLSDFEFALTNGLPEKLACGGMGYVVKARQLSLNRELIIKFPKNRFDRFAAQSILEEARIQGRIQHRAVLPVLAVGEDPKHGPFFVMPMIEGETLGELLDQRQNDSENFDSMLKIFRYTCSAVGAAHAQGVIHGDLKPEQIMHGTDGQSFVLDWGMAAERKVTEDGEDAPAASRGGTHAYMAPEQASKNEVTTGTDVFSLGAILYEILTTKSPYWSEGADENTIKVRAKDGELGNAYRSLEKQSHKHPELAALARRCLDRDNAKRPKDGSSVTAEIVRYLEDQRKRFHTLEADEKYKRKWRRVMVVIVSALLPIAVFVGSYVNKEYWNRKQREAAIAHAKEANATAIDKHLANCMLALRNDDVHNARASIEELQRRSKESVSEGQRQRIKQCEIDLAVLDVFQTLDRERYSIDDKQQRNRAKRLDDEYRAAFAKHGISPFMDQEAILRFSAATAIREQLIEHLDFWLSLNHAPEVISALKAVDPEIYRDDVRAAMLRKDDVALAKLFRQAELAKQPVQFSVIFANVASLDERDRRKALERANQRERNNVAILMALGDSYPTNQRSGASERVRWYQSAVAVRPDNVIFKLNLGLAQEETGNIEAAEACCKDILRVAPLFASAWNNYGNILRRKGDVEGARASYEKARKLAPKMGSAHYNLGVLAFEAGEAFFEDAERHLNEANQVSGGFASAYSLLGKMRRRQLKVDEAIQFYDKALEINPKHLHALNNRGNALDIKRKFKDAIKDLEKAIQLDREYDEPFNGLASIHIRTGKPEQAIEYAKEALRLNPHHILAHYHLGKAYLLKNQADLAVGAFTEAVDRNPNHADAHAGLGDALLAKGKTKDAIASYQKAINLQKDHIAAHSGLGRAWVNLKQWDPAKIALDNACALTPNDSLLYQLLGMVHRNRNELNLALDCQNKAITLNPKNAGALLNKGNLFSARNDIYALGLFHESIRLNGNEWRAHNALGELQLMMGNTEGAIESFKNALRLDSTAISPIRGFEKALLEKARVGS